MKYFRLTIGAVDTFLKDNLINATLGFNHSLIRSCFLKMFPLKGTPLLWKIMFLHAIFAFREVYFFHSEQTGR